MRRTVLFAILLAAVLLGGGIFLSTLPASAQYQPQVKPTEIVQGDSKLVTASDAALGYTAQFSNPYCYSPDPGQNVCYINIRSAHFGATAPDSLHYVKVLIDGKMVAKMAAFFTEEMSLSFDQNPQGYKVTCGTAGEEGNADPKVGRSYTVGVEGYAYPDSFRLGNYHSNVGCPAYVPSQP